MPGNAKTLHNELRNTLSLVYIKGLALRHKLTSSSMKTIAVFACALVCVAYALQVPSSVIRVRRDSADDVVNVVEWMTGSSSGAPQWTYRLRSDVECRICPILHAKPFTGWPADCDKCVQPFLAQVKAVPYCKRCYENQENCQYCQQEMKKVVHSGSGYRGPEANQYLQKIYIY